MGESSEVPALRRGLAVLRLLATRPGPVTAAAIAREAGLPRSTTYHLLNELEAAGFVVHLPVGTPVRPGHRGLRAGLGVPAPRPPRAAGRAVAAQARRPRRAHRAPGRAARQRVALPDQGTSGPAGNAGHRGRRPAAGAADRVRPGDPAAPAGPARPGVVPVGGGVRRCAPAAARARSPSCAAPSPRNAGSAGRSRTATSPTASLRWPARSSTTAPARWRRSA